MNRRLWVTAALAASALAATPAVAQEEGWTASITPYFWAPGYDNEVTNNFTGETLDTSTNFGDWIGGLRGIPIIVKGEVRYDRVGVIADLIYLPLSEESTIERPILGPIKTDADLTTTTFTGEAYYRVFQGDRLDIDLLGGFRYVKLGVDLEVDGPGAGFSRDADTSFTEAIIGVRATQQLGTKTSITGYGDWGGFGGSKDVWQLSGTVNYQWTSKFAVSGGWRHFVIDVEKDLLSSKVTLSGPLVGVTYRF